MSAKKKKEEYPPIPHVPNDEDKNLIPTWFNQERTKILTTPDVVEPRDGTCVYYWMQRDMRTQDNWALLYAEYLAKERNVPLKVLYVLPPPVLSSDEGSNSDSDSDGTDSDSNVQVHLPPKVCEMKMTERHGSFLLGGLKIVEEELHAKKVPFQILTPHEHSQVGQSVHDCVTSQDASVVICDMSPLRQYREWMETQASPLMIQSNLPLYQVDAHNVVPVWFASPKRQVGARTLRPKINKLLQDFMTHFPSFEGNCHISEKQQQPLEPVSWEECETHLELDESVKPVEWAQPGRKAAMARFEEFTTSPTEGLKNFDTLRNDPNFQNVCSNLSPWVNYGHVSFQRLALEARALKKYPNGTASYIEEGIVRRELSDNFVYYSPDNYDSLETAAVWAQDSLNLHAADEREYIYSLTEFQEATTHDDLWNAAQTQLNIEGKMHGFLRMYWAKKILEWTVSPAQALRFGLYLNDRYALDGNDPNGFTGVGWSVMGIHDMGWKERPIFGKIRFMNYAGCKRKFKVDQFVSRYNDGPPGDLKSAKAAAKPASKKKAVASATKSKGAAKKKAAPRSNKRKILEHLAKKKSPAKKTKL
jgi:deoxyribodipyrimidine photo-lyase